MNTNNSADRFRRLRVHLDLDQESMAARLLISRNYLSQIENGREPSMLVLGHLERLEREAGMHTNIDGGIPVLAVHEDPSPSAAPGLSPELAARLRADEKAKWLRERFETVAALAAGNEDRIAWLTEQIVEHCLPPSHWRADAPPDRLRALEILFRSSAVPAPAEAALLDAARKKRIESLAALMPKPRRDAPPKEATG